MCIIYKSLLLSTLGACWEAHYSIGRRPRDATSVVGCYVGARLAVARSRGRRAASATWLLAQGRQRTATATALERSPTLWNATATHATGSATTASLGARERRQLQGRGRGARAGWLRAQVVARRVRARQVALAHGGHARLQLRDDGTPQH